MLRKRIYQESQKETADDDSALEQKKPKHESDLEDILPALNERYTTPAEIVRVNKEKFERQIKEFYSPVFTLTEEYSRIVENCIKFYCKEYPNVAGLILNENIHKFEKLKISEMLIKAGANGLYCYQHGRSSFETALFFNAPASLLNLLIEHRAVSFELTIINTFYNSDFIMREGYEPIVKECIEIACHNNPQSMGRYLRANIHKVSKSQISQWIIESGADLQVQISGTSALYCAITAHLPKQIYAAFCQKGVTDLSVYDHGYQYGAVTLALINNNKVAFAFYSQYLSEDVKKAAYLLKDYNFYAQHSFNRGDARMILWEISDADVRRATLDGQIISDTFAGLGSVEQCIKSYNEFAEITDGRKDTSSFFCKSCDGYSRIKHELLFSASQRICELVKNLGASTRFSICEMLLTSSPIFLAEHNRLGFNSESLRVQLTEMRGIAKKSIEVEEKSLSRGNVRN